MEMTKMINFTTRSMSITWLIEVYKVCQRLILAAKVELVESSNLGTLLRCVYLFSSNGNQNCYPLHSKYIHALLVVLPHIIHIFLLFI